MALNTNKVLEEHDDLQSRRDTLDDATQSLASAIEAGANEVTLDMLRSEKEDAASDFDDSDKERLEEIEAFIESAGGYVAVRDSEFIEDSRNETKTYAYNYAVGSLDVDDLPEILRENINWTGVWDDLSSEFTSVSFDGADYWVRA